MAEELRDAYDPADVPSKSKAAEQSVAQTIIPPLPLDDASVCAWYDFINKCAAPVTVIEEPTDAEPTDVEVKPDQKQEFVQQAWDLALTLIECPETTYDRGYDALEMPRKKWVEFNAAQRGRVMKAFTDEIIEKMGWAVRAAIDDIAVGDDEKDE